MLLLVGQAGATGLTFFGETKNERIPIYTSEGNSIVFRNGSNVRALLATSETMWSVEGDFSTHHHEAAWSPNYIIRAVSDEAGEPDEDKSFYANVAVSLRPAAGRPEAPTQRSAANVGQLFSLWPSAANQPGVLVFAWILDGQIVQIEPRAWSSNNDKTPEPVEVLFKLSAAEARGQPVIFFIQNGAVVPPAPQFSDANQQAAFVAACLDNLDTLKTLRQNGTALPIVSAQRDTLLHFAAEAGSPRVVEYLLAQKKDAWKDANANGATPIDTAVRNGRSEVVARLLAAAPMNQWPEDLRTRTLITAAQNGHYETVKELIEAKANIEAEDSWHRTPIAAAIGSGHVKIADLLYRRKGQLGTGDQAARVLIAKAARGATQMVRWLIAHGVEADFVQQGRTALMAGARKGTRDLANVLLDAKAKIDRVDETGASALMRAVMQGNAAYADALLARGADPTLRDNSGNTPLNRAATFNRSGAADVLLQRGARLDEKNRDGATPLALALRFGSRDCLELLVAKGAHLDLDSPSVGALLERAIVLDQAALLNDALKRGWPIDKPLSGDWTAPAVADVCQSERCIEILATAGSTARATKHPPLVGEKELDAPLTKKSSAPPEDPRDVSEGYDEEIVSVTAIVDQDGRVRFAKMKPPSDSRLVDATLKAVDAMLFDPPRRGGQPCIVRVTLPIVFPSSATRLSTPPAASAPSPTPTIKPRARSPRA